MSMLGRMFGFGRNEHYDKGIRLFDQGMYEEAIAELAQLAPGGKGSGRTDALTQRLSSFYIAEAYANLGTVALQKQRYDRAKDALGKALEINPHYADLHFHYGRACRKDGDAEGAIRAFQNSLGINPRFAKAHFFLGLSLYESGRYEGVEHIQKAVELDRAFQTDQLSAALTAHAAGDHPGAQTLFERIAETDVDDIAFHAKLGSDLYRRGEYEQAANEFRKALALNGGYADLRNHLAISLNAIGRYDEAIEEFRQALAINPDYTEARTNLALTLRAAGRKDEAAAEFARVLERDPDNAIARGNLVV